MNPDKTKNLVSIGLPVLVLGLGLASYACKTGPEELDPSCAAKNILKRLQ